jgi:hypothetical protein
MTARPTGPVRRGARISSCEKPVPSATSLSANNIRLQTRRKTVIRGHILYGPTSIDKIEIHGVGPTHRTSMLPKSQASGVVVLSPILVVEPRCGSRCPINLMLSRLVASAWHSFAIFQHLAAVSFVVALRALRAKLFARSNAILAALTPSCQTTALVRCSLAQPSRPAKSAPEFPAAETQRSPDL